MTTDCLICPGPQCVQGYHDASLSIRRWLRERVTATLSQPSRETLAAPKRHFVARRPEDAPAVDVRPAKGKPEHIRETGRAALTAETILARQAAGETIMQIAAAAGCSWALIEKIVRRASDRDRTGSIAAAREALRTCPTEGCGRTKKPSSAVCRFCKAKGVGERSAA